MVFLPAFPGRKVLGIYKDRMCVFSKIYKLYRKSASSLFKALEVSGRAALTSRAADIIGAKVRLPLMTSISKISGMGVFQETHQPVSRAGP